MIKSWNVKRELWFCHCEEARVCRSKLCERHPEICVGVPTILTNAPAKKTWPPLGLSTYYLAGMLALARSRKIKLSRRRPAFSGRLPLKLSLSLSLSLSMQILPDLPTNATHSFHFEAKARTKAKGRVLGAGTVSVAFIGPLNISVLALGKLPFWESGQYGR